MAALVRDRSVRLWPHGAGRTRQASAPRPEWSAGRGALSLSELRLENLPSFLTLTHLWGNARVTVGEDRAARVPPAAQGLTRQAPPAPSERRDVHTRRGLRAPPQGPRAGKACRPFVRR